MVALYAARRHRSKVAAANAMGFLWERSVSRIFLKVLLSTLVVLWGATASAEEIPPALRKAVETDPRVLSARANLHAKQVEAEGAISVYLPTIRGTGSTGSSKSSDPLTREGTKQVYGLGVEQPLPLFGRESARVRVAREAMKVEETETARVEQTVLAEILEVATEASARKEMLLLRERLAANLREQVAAAGEAVAVGGMKLTELSLLQSRAAQARALYAVALADLAVAEAKLRQRLPNGPPLSLNDVSLRRWWPVSPRKETLLEAAVSTVPTLLKARATAEQAEAEHVAARADLWPKISLNAQWQRGSFGEASADSQVFFLGLSVPLYEGGAGWAGVKSAFHRSQAAHEMAEYEHRNVAQRVDEAWARWQAAEAAVHAWQEAEAQEKSVVDFVEQQLASGAATRFTLLQAHQALLGTRLQGVESRWQQYVAFIRLLLESGALTLTPAKPKP